MSTDRIVFIDPGKHDISIAVFQGGYFITAEFFRGGSCAKHRRVLAYSPDIVVCEKPQVYQGAKNTKDANPADLIDLAVSVGACMSAAPRAYSVAPNHWKGQVPKNIHHERYEPRLTPAMRSCINVVAPGLQHNVRDAICMGLWWFDTHPLGSLGYEAQ